MRTTIAALAATAAAMLATAGSAAADVPNAKVQTFQSPGQAYQVCDTPYSYGVAGQYGAWGDYIDGCTVRLTCPAANPRPCLAISDSSITSLYFGRDSRVTQNARLRVFPNATSGSATWWRDRSCAGSFSYCESADHISIAPGQSASTQCNGVREHYTGAPQATNACYITMRY
jgi:hypothetical protein